MMLNAPSFFAGIAPVLGLLVVGFGGGVMMSGVISDNTPREPSKVEKRAAEAAKPPAGEVKPATAPVVVAPQPQPAPPPAQVAEPAPAPQPVQTPAAQPVQQAAAPPAPPALQAEPPRAEPAPQVRRVDLPP